MLRPLIMCFLLCVVSADRKRRHDDDGNFDDDHEAFLGEDEAKVFQELPPEESQRRLSLIVDKIDTDGDGQVSQVELRLWIQVIQTKQVEHNVQQQWNDFDSNNDGLISWNEYRKATYGNHTGDPQGGAEHNYTTAMLRDARRFRAADTNGDQSADRQEFTAFLHPEDYKHMKEVMLQETMEDMDKNGDGFIDLKEYMDDTLEDEDSEWAAAERQQFAEFRDKNKDGKMDREETLEWILPSDYDHSESEAKHLLQECDADQDGKLSKKEILDKYDVFVGSQVTEYGDALLRHDEF